MQLHRYDDDGIYLLRDHMQADRQGSTYQPWVHRREYDARMSPNQSFKGHLV